MEVEAVADPTVGGGDDHGPVLARPAHVADESLVEDGVDRGTVVPSTLGQTSDLGPGGRSFGAGGRFRARLRPSVRSPPATFVTVRNMNHAVQYRLVGDTAREIARSVEDAVRRGDLGPGDGLPTVRGLATDLGVSPSTVANAYRELQRRGVLIGSGRRGTRVRRQPPVSPRLPMAVPAGIRDLRSGGPDPALLPPIPRLSSHTRGYGTSAVSPLSGRGGRPGAGGRRYRRELVGRRRRSPRRGRTGARGLAPPRRPGRRRGPRIYGGTRPAGRPGHGSGPGGSRRATGSAPTGWRWRSSAVLTGCC